MEKNQFAMAISMAPKQSAIFDEGDNLRNRIVVMRCPHCNSPFEDIRFDSSHPCYSLDKPLKRKAEKATIKVYVCKNPKCKAKITVYWCDETLFLNRL